MSRGTEPKHRLSWTADVQQKFAGDETLDELDRECVSSMVLANTARQDRDVWRESVPVECVQILARIPVLRKDMPPNAQWYAFQAENGWGPRSFRIGAALVALLATDHTMVTPEKFRALLEMPALGLSDEVVTCALALVQVPCGDAPEFGLHHEGDGWKLGLLEVADEICTWNGSTVAEIFQGTSPAAMLTCTMMFVPHDREPFFGALVPPDDILRPLRARFPGLPAERFTGTFVERIHRWLSGGGASGTIGAWDIPSPSAMVRFGRVFWYASVPTMHRTRSTMKSDAVAVSGGCVLASAFLAKEAGLVDVADLHVPELFVSAEMLAVVALALELLPTWFEDAYGEAASPSEPFTFRRCLRDACRTVAAATRHRRRYLARLEFLCDLIRTSHVWPGVAWGRQVDTWVSGMTGSGDDTASVVAPPPLADHTDSDTAPPAQDHWRQVVSGFVQRRYPQDRDEAAFGRVRNALQVFSGSVEPAVGNPTDGKDSDKTPGDGNPTAPGPSQNVSRDIDSRQDTGIGGDAEATPHRSSSLPFSESDSGGGVEEDEFPSTSSPQSAEEKGSPPAFAPAPSLFEKSGAAVAVGPAASAWEVAVQLLQRSTTETSAETMAAIQAVYWLAENGTHLPPSLTATDIQRVVEGGSTPDYLKDAFRNGLARGLVPGSFDHEFITNATGAFSAKYGSLPTEGLLGLCPGDTTLRRGLELLLCVRALRTGWIEGSFAEMAVMWFAWDGFLAYTHAAEYVAHQQFALQFLSDVTANVLGDGKVDNFLDFRTVSAGLDEQACRTHVMLQRALETWNPRLPTSQSKEFASWVLSHLVMSPDTANAVQAFSAGYSIEPVQVCAAAVWELYVGRGLKDVQNLLPGRNSGLLVDLVSDLHAWFSDQSLFFQTGSDLEQSSMAITLLDMEELRDFTAQRTGATTAWSLRVACRLLGEADPESPLPPYARLAAAQLAYEFEPIARISSVHGAIRLLAYWALDGGNPEFDKLRHVVGPLACAWAEMRSDDEDWLARMVGVRNLADVPMLNQLFNHDLSEAAIAKVFGWEGKDSFAFSNEIAGVLQDSLGAIGTMVAETGNAMCTRHIYPGVPSANLRVCVGTLCSLLPDSDEAYPFKTFVCDGLLHYMVRESRRAHAVFLLKLLSGIADGGMRTEPGVWKDAIDTYFANGTDVFVAEVRTGRLHDGNMGEAPCSQAISLLVLCDVLTPPKAESPYPPFNAQGSPGCEAAVGNAMIQRLVYWNTKLNVMMPGFLDAAKKLAFSVEPEDRPESWVELLDSLGAEDTSNRERTAFITELRRVIVGGESNSEDEYEDAREASEGTVEKSKAGEPEEKAQDQTEEATIAEEKALEEPETPTEEAGGTKDQDLDTSDAESQPNMVDEPQAAAPNTLTPLPSPNVSNTPVFKTPFMGSPPFDGGGDGGGPLSGALPTARKAVITHEEARKRRADETARRRDAKEAGREHAYRAEFQLRQRQSATTHSRLAQELSRGFDAGQVPALASATGLDLENPANIARLFVGSGAPTSGSGFVALDVPSFTRWLPKIAVHHERGALNARVLFDCIGEPNTTGRCMPWAVFHDASPWSTLASEPGMAALPPHVRAMLERQGSAAASRGTPAPSSTGSGGPSIRTPRSRLAELHQDNWKCLEGPPPTVASVSQTTPRRHATSNLSDPSFVHHVAAMFWLVHVLLALPKAEVGAQGTTQTSGGTSASSQQPLVLPAPQLRALEFLHEHLHLRVPVSTSALMLYGKLTVDTAGIAIPFSVHNAHVREAGYKDAGETLYVVSPGADARSATYHTLGGAAFLRDLLFPTVVFNNSQQVSGTPGPANSSTAIPATVPIRARPAGVNERQTLLRWAAANPRRGNGSRNTARSSTYGGNRNGKLGSVADARKVARGAKQKVATRAARAVWNAFHDLVVHVATHKVLQEQLTSRAASLGGFAARTAVQGTLCAEAEPRLWTGATPIHTSLWFHVAYTTYVQSCVKRNRAVLVAAISRALKDARTELVLSRNGGRFLTPKLPDGMPVGTVPLASYVEIVRFQKRSTEGSGAGGDGTEAALALKPWSPIGKPGRLEVVDLRAEGAYKRATRRSLRSHGGRGGASFPVAGAGEPTARGWFYPKYVRGKPTCAHVSTANNVYTRRAASLGASQLRFKKPANGLGEGQWVCTAPRDPYRSLANTMHMVLEQEILTDPSRLASQVDDDGEPILDPESLRFGTAAVSVEAMDALVATNVAQTQAWRRKARSK